MEKTPLTGDLSGFINADTDLLSICLFVAQCVPVAIMNGRSTACVALHFFHFQTQDISIAQDLQSVHHSSSPV
jgi:hypothetical protein